jgi:zinc/manganese transport system permease protein
MNEVALDLSVIAAPLVAGVLVIATHVPLGREVLRRGIIFIDLAVAQIAGLGMIAAQTLGWALGGWGTQIAAAASALLGGLILRGFEHRWPGHQEALIGTTFVLAATGGLLLLTGNPHGAEHMTELLAGQLLWVRPDQLSVVGGLYLPILLAWFTLGPGGLRFYILFALTVTASVQLVGVYLVFASLIIPALSVRRLGPWQGIAAAYALGGLAYASGLLCSAVFDLPAGPTVVWLLALLGLITGTLIGHYVVVSHAQGG